MKSMMSLLQTFLLVALCIRNAGCGTRRNRYCAIEGFIPQTLNNQNPTMPS